jgi:hypothetical protein
MKYEVIDGQQRVTVRYYVIWNDEVHPIGIVHRIYTPFRILYYGSQIDSEKIEISVDKGTGRILFVSFQTESENTRAFIPSHILATLCLQDGKSLISTGQMKPRECEVKMMGKRIVLEVKTWNHEFALSSLNESQSTVYDLPLEYLNDTDYVRLRWENRITSTTGPKMKKIGLRVLLAAWFTSCLLLFPLTFLLLRNRIVGTKWSSLVRTNLDDDCWGLTQPMV